MKGPRALPRIAFVVIETVVIAEMLFDTTGWADPPFHLPQDTSTSGRYACILVVLFFLYTCFYIWQIPHLG